MAKRRKKKLRKKLKRKLKKEEEEDSILFFKNASHNDCVGSVFFIPVLHFHHYHLNQYLRFLLGFEDFLYLFQLRF